MAECRTCGEEIRWVFTPGGGRIPVVECDGGELVLEDEGDRVVCYRFHPTFHPGPERYASHLDECDGGIASNGRGK
jgi:hypothetical protein